MEKGDGWRATHASMLGRRAPSPPSPSPDPGVLLPHCNSCSSSAGMALHTGHTGCGDGHLQNPMGQPEKLLPCCVVSPAATSPQVTCATPGSASPPNHCREFEAFIQLIFAAEMRLL